MQGFYGFATFLLSPFTGMPTDVAPGKIDYGTCWGHLGATYGWNSVVQYTPGTKFSIAVATNVETNEQVQCSTVQCSTLYNGTAKTCRKYLWSRIEADGRWCGRWAYINIFSGKIPYFQTEIQFICLL
jgi:hypothetical protein